MMPPRPRSYRSYLLRMWQVANGEEGAWRASLETPGTGERRGFGSLAELFRWLHDQTRPAARVSGPGTEDRTPQRAAPGEVSEKTIQR